MGFFYWGEENNPRSQQPAPARAARQPFFYWGEPDRGPAEAVPEPEPRSLFGGGGRKRRPSGGAAAAPAGPSRHEQAHARAGRGERLPGARWYTDRQGNRRISHEVPSGRDGARRAAVVQAAGYLSSDDGGFEDRDGDRQYAQVLAREAGVPLAEIEAEARRKGYVL
jgi:hypothetical protein